MLSTLSYILAVALFAWFVFGREERADPPRYICLRDELTGKETVLIHHITGRRAWVDEVQEDTPA